MSEAVRAPVWRRLAAAAVDGVFFVMAASLLSVALYAATDGRFRAYVFQPVDRCAPTAGLSPAAMKAVASAIPGQSARVISATACRRLFLGLESGRFVTVRIEIQQGDALTAAAVLLPVNRAGEPLQPVALGWAYPFLFVVAMAGGEGLLAGTPGKAALALRVVTATGGRLGVRRALARKAIIYSWLLVGAVTVFALPKLGQVAPALLAHTGTVRIVEFGVVGALAFAALALLLLRRPDPAYDRWTGARVIRA